MAVLTFCGRYVHAVDLDIYNWSRSDVNVSIERTCTTSYSMAIVMLVISVTVLQSFTVEICMTLTFTFITDKCRFMRIECSCDVLIVGNGSVGHTTVSVIFAVERRLTLTLTFRMAKVKLKKLQSKRHVRLNVLEIEMCHGCQRWRDNHLLMCTIFDFFISFCSGR